LSSTVVIFGGRAADKSALKDTWGLRRHQNGTWDWVKAPYKKDGLKPASRYHHSIFFYGTLMFVFGGRGNNP
jgi:protein phosphatase